MHDQEAQNVNKSAFSIFVCRKSQRLFSDGCHLPSSILIVLLELPSCKAIAQAIT